MNGRDLARVRQDVLRMTQEELAKALGVSRHLILRSETGERELRRVELLAIQALLVAFRFGVLIPEHLDNSLADLVLGEETDKERAA